MYNLPQVNEATIRSCSGPVLRSLMTWSVSVLCPVREGVGLRPWRVGYGKMRVLYGTGVGGAVLVLDDGTCVGGDLVRGRGRACGCPRGRGQPDLWSWSLSVWYGTPLPTATFPHDLVQSRRRIRLRGPSVASGVIPTKSGRNGPVPATPGRAPRGRWRSSPWKRCNHAAPRGRGQGAPRTARCIKTHGHPDRAHRAGGSGSAPHR